MFNALQDMDSTLRPSKAAKYTGWEASSSRIREVLEKEHPIDGILGETDLFQGRLLSPVRMNAGRL